MHTAITSSPPNHEDPLLVTSRLEIAALLRSLKEQKALISARIDRGSQTMITTLLDIDEKHNAFIVDVAREARFNSRATQAGDISFEAVLDKIQIKFSGSAATLCRHDNKPALRLAFPDALRRIQRREFYRVATPASQPAHCAITPPAAAGLPENTRITLNLKDISLGGISLIDNDKQLGVASDTLYSDCRIVLPEVGSVTTALRVVRAFDETLPNEKAVRYVGCAFVDLPSSMMTTVQRYIGVLERRLGAKRFGAD